MWWHVVCVAGANLGRRAPYLRSEVSLMRLLVILWGFAFAMACSSGSGSSGGSGSAVAQCEQLAQQWCDKSVDCLIANGQVAAAERNQNVSQCLQVSGQQLPCQRAVAVGPSYDSCVSDISSMDCGSFANPSSVSLPATCKGVIKVDGRTSDPPPGGGSSPG